jgi:hypothetical protein
MWFTADVRSGKVSIHIDKNIASDLVVLLETVGCLNSVRRLSLSFSACILFQGSKLCQCKCTDYFKSLALKHQGEEIGVLVSGATKMQEDVAYECRHHSLSRTSTVVMSYHSVSFEL